MKLVFDLEKLKAGDILLTGGKGKISSAITLTTLSRYSHAALFVDSTGFIEANLDGVTVNNPQRQLFDSVDAVTLLRLKDEPEPEIISKICLYAYTKVGTEYSKSEATKALVRGMGKQELNRQFCSRLVAEAFAHANINLVENPRYCTPKDLLSSPIVAEVDDFLRSPSPAEVEFAESHSPLDDQAEIIAIFLEDVRIVSNEDIQSMRQVIYLLIEHPELDETVTNLLKASGYLEIYKWDEENNPWRHGLCTYSEAGFTGKKAIERAVRDGKMAAKLIEKFRGELSVSRELNERHPRQYFAVLVELYETLEQWQIKALRIAQENQRA